MDKTLIITESRTVAKSIAQALGANILRKGYFGKGAISVAWTGGSLITATPKCKFEFSVCSDMSADETFAANYDFRVRKDGKGKGAKGNSRPSEKDAAQAAAIERLWREADIVCNAMKPSAAGEVAFTSLAMYVGIKRPTMRLWLRSVTRSAILDALDYPADASPAYALFHDNAIAEYTIGARPMRGESLSPGSPDWNMDSLRQAAADTKGWAPAKTTAVAYSLYNKGLISYPAEEAEVLPKGVAAAILKALQNLRHHPELGARVPQIVEPSDMNPSEGAGCGILHHGVVITGLYPADLTPEEKHLYGLVASHTLDMLSD